MQKMYVYLLFVGAIVLSIGIIPTVLAQQYNGTQSNPQTVGHVIIEPMIGSANSANDCTYIEYGCFSPGKVIVSVGDIVVFSNTDSAAHAFTSGEATDADSVGTVFYSGLVASGDSFEWIPTETGEVPYFDLVHPWMTGMIIVSES